MCNDGLLDVLANVRAGSNSGSKVSIQAPHGGRISVLEGEEIVVVVHSRRNQIFGGLE